MLQNTGQRKNVSPPKIKRDDDKNAHHYCPANHKTQGRCTRLIDSLRLAHGGLEVEGTDVLPVLLEKGDQEVDGELDVGHQLLLSHSDVAHSNTKAEHLLELELDGALKVVNLGGHIVIVGKEGREFSGLVQTRTKKPWNLPDDALGGEEGIVLLSELLDKLLVLVHLLEGVDVHRIETKTNGVIHVLSITENANAELSLGCVGQPDLTGETLILLGIVVFETNLELDGLGELALCLLGGGSDG